MEKNATSDCLNKNDTLDKADNQFLHSIDDTLIKKIAQLSKIDIPEEQMAEYVRNISNIILLVDQIMDVKQQAVGLEQNSMKLSDLREDKVENCIDPAAYLTLAPESYDNYYAVPAFRDEKKDS